MSTLNEQIMAAEAADKQKVYIEYLLKEEAEALAGDILGFLSKVQMDVNAAQNDGHVGRAADFRVYGGEFEAKYRELYYTRAAVLKDLIIKQLGLKEEYWQTTLFLSISSEFIGEKVEHIDKSVTELLRLSALLSKESSIHPVKPR